MTYTPHPYTPAYYSFIGVYYSSKFKSQSKSCLVISGLNTFIIFYQSVFSQIYSGVFKSLRHWGTKKWREVVIPTPLQYFCCHCGTGVNFWSQTTGLDILFIWIWYILDVTFNPLVGVFSSRWRRSNKLRQTCSKLWWNFDLHTSKYIIFNSYL